MDVHKESIVAATATQGDTDVQLCGKIGGTLDALDKLLKRLASPKFELRVVYEAGPCGYVIYRHLKKRQIHCEVIAPSLIPTKASDRVKTDRRDARQLARLFRAGELTAIYVPDEEDEAMRDLVRARDRAMIDQRKARQRLKGFLLRLGHRYSKKGNWSEVHLRYLASLKMTHATQQIAFEEYPGSHHPGQPTIGALDPSDGIGLAGMETRSGGAGSDEHAGSCLDHGNDVGGRGGGPDPV